MYFCIGNIFPIIRVYEFARIRECLHVLAHVLLSVENLIFYRHTFIVYNFWTIDCIFDFCLDFISLSEQYLSDSFDFQLLSSYKKIFQELSSKTSTLILKTQMERIILSVLSVLFKEYHD